MTIDVKKNFDLRKSDLEMVVAGLRGAVVDQGQDFARAALYSIYKLTYGNRVPSGSFQGLGDRPGRLDKLQAAQAGQCKL